ncbi:MAG: class I SAM-dependent methyltransferase [Sandaracinaceae bacterium]|nr:class I SAM-dependent methyltransferase [Myxococcales bacterium]MCB9656569.1 class I SAM-dependent methyltransferase [Sandaracinaceae bacterium]
MDLTTEIVSPPPNAAFIDCWSSVIAPKFERHREVLVEGACAHSDRVLAEHGPQPGQVVLDVGCGWADTSLALARAVGPTGQVIAQDCMPTFMARGQAQAQAQGLGQLRFAIGDAQVQRFGVPFDLIFSRFGTMFFGSPVAALRNLHAQLRPGGRLMMITWRRLEDNAWLYLAKQVARRYLPAPGEEAQTCGPGPLSMSDEAVVRAQLEAAGFVDIRFERSDAEMPMGATVAEALSMMMALGPAGEVIREAGALGERMRPVIEDELAAAVAGSWRPGLGVRMGSSAWAIHARRA